MTSWIDWIIIQWHLESVELLFNDILDWLDIFDSILNQLNYYLMTSWIGWIYSIDLESVKLLFNDILNWLDIFDRS